MPISPTAEPPYLKPLPEITDFNRPFFDALRRHQFVVPRCMSCGDFHWIPYPACRTCLSDDLVWTPVSGAATLYSYTVMHSGPGAFSRDVPYTAAIGELDEHPRPCLVIANVVDEPADQPLAVGLPIEIVYEDVPDQDITVFHWAVRTTP